MKKKTLYVVSSLILIVGLLVFLYKQKKGAEKDIRGGIDISSIVSNGSERKAFSSVENSLPWKVGNQYVYQSALSSSLLLEKVSAPMISFSVDGNILIDVVESRAGKTLLHVQYESPVFDVTSESAPNPKSFNPQELVRIKQSLSTPFFISFDGHGALSEVLVREEMVSHVQNTFKTVASLIQYVMPENDEAAWKVTEGDRSGEYLAAYVKNSALRTTQKTKLHYLDGATLLESTSNSKPEVINSQTTYKQRRDGTIARLDAKDYVRIRNEKLQFTGGSQTKLQMTLQNVRQSTKNAADLIAIARLYVASPPDGPATRSADQRIIDHAKIAGLDLDMALTLLDRFAGESSDHRHKRQKAFLAMEALFRQNPESMRRAVQKIREGNPYSKMLIAALGYAGTPETQVALMELLSSGYEEEPLAVMRALSIGDEPTEQNIEFHKQMMSDPKLGHQARFGLGADAFILLEKGKKKEANGIFNLLARELEDAVSQDDIILTLKALGNTGYPRLVEVIPRYLSQSDEAIRSVAVNALRKTPTGGTDDLIASTLIHDTSVTVRRIAIKVLAERPVTKTALTALDQVVHNDQSKSVRHGAVNLLNDLSANPEAAAILRWVAENEREDKIREVAEKALAT